MKKFKDIKTCEDCIFNYDCYFCKLYNRNIFKAIEDNNIMDFCKLIEIIIKENDDEIL